MRISDWSSDVCSSDLAESLNGRPIDPGTTDLEEQKVLNIVEEMAIASGIPVPPVYVMEDESINAFAAGHTPQDAVIGVTRGCISLLSRDELQGVVAHEFSHIFHGDMRLHTKLVATLKGRSEECRYGKKWVRTGRIRGV